MNSILNQAKVKSLGKLQLLREELQTAYAGFPLAKEVCVYACGSLGRLESVANSDLDLFFISMDKERNDIPNLDTYRFFSILYTVTHNLGHPDPSKSGLYWLFTSKKDLLDIGSREEDYINSFTARMLLILESKPIVNESAYHSLIEETVQKYFIDYEENEDEFYPLFLMNDIHRYWYTLTLNYEYRRDASDDRNTRYWKRLKLKFSRLITCYSLLACLYEKRITPKRVTQYIEMTPFERLHALAEIVLGLGNIIEQAEEEYGWYMNLRETQSPDWWEEEMHKREALEHADKFHSIIVHRLMGTMAKYNPELCQKSDTYCADWCDL